MNNHKSNAIIVSCCVITQVTCATCFLDTLEVHGSARLVFNSLHVLGVMQYSMVRSPVNRMKLVQPVVMLFGLSQSYSNYSYVQLHSNQCECKRYNNNSRSIIVKDTM